MSNYVLVVDDNQSDLILSSAHIEKSGYLSIKAENGLQALELLDDLEVCLFVLDLQMPRMGGIELIKRVRRIEKFKKTPILVTSARNQSSDVKLAIVSGATDYMVKPIDSLVFEEKLSKLLQKDIVWQEYSLPQDSSESEGYLKDRFQIRSVSEVGMTIFRSFSLEVGEHIEVHTMIGKQLESVNAKVESCAKVNSGYLMKVSFIGLTEAARKEVRLFCRSIWTKGQR